MPEPPRVYADVPQTGFGVGVAERERKGTVIHIKKKNRNQNKESHIPPLAGIKKVDRQKKPTGFVVVTYQGGQEYTYSIHTFCTKFNVRKDDALAISGMGGVVDVDSTAVLWLVRNQKRIRLGSWKNRQKKRK